MSSDLKSGPAWFESWFDSPYYHTLYQHRDDAEAELFMRNILTHLALPPHARILDLACGKGRHARYLHSQGYDLTGVDLSAQSIAYCKQFEEEGLEFFEHDMRRSLRINYFHAVFNLFTSFGYFDSDYQNQLVLDAAAKGLKKDGIFLIDYINAIPAQNKLIPKQTITAGGIAFDIEKKIQNNCIVKSIRFSDQGHAYRFTEQVRLYQEAELINKLDQAGLEVTASFGDYSLNPYQADTSPRLILISRKR